MQLPPLFSILSAGHSSVHHQWQPWINSFAASVQASPTCLVGNSKGWRTGRGLFTAGSLQAPTALLPLKQWTWPSLLRPLPQLCLTSTAAGSHAQIRGSTFPVLSHRRFFSSDGYCQVSYCIPVLLSQKLNQRSCTKLQATQEGLLLVLIFKKLHRRFPKPP